MCCYAALAMIQPSMLSMKISELCTWLGKNSLKLHRAIAIHSSKRRNILQLRVDIGKNHARATNYKTTFD